MTRSKSSAAAATPVALLVAAALLAGCPEKPEGELAMGPVELERKPREAVAHLEPIFLEDGTVSPEHPEHQATVVYHGDSVRFVCPSCAEHGADYRVVRIEPLRDKMRSVLKDCAEAESMIRMLPRFEGGALQEPLFGDWTPPDYGREAVTTPPATHQLAELDGVEIFAVTFEVRVGEAAPVEIDPHIRVHGGTAK